LIFYVILSKSSLEKKIEVDYFKYLKCIIKPLSVVKLFNMSVRSNSFNSSNSSNKSTKKTGKFCKVCFDSGKDESIYTSHFVKSAPSLGVIVCPTLKATECRYCKKSGHTVKFCKALQEKEKMNKKRKEMPTKTPVKKEKVVEKVRNPFEVLIMDSDDEDEDVVVSTIVTSMTSMTSMTSAPKVALTGWAAIAALPKKEEPKNVTLVVKEKPVEESGNSYLKKDFSNRVWKSWADYSDSDDDEEEDYEQLGVGAW
jgi:hypothetical protein